MNPGHSHSRRTTARLLVVASATIFAISGVEAQSKRQIRVVNSSWKGPVLVQRAECDTPTVKLVGRPTSAPRFRPVVYKQRGSEEFICYVFWASQVIDKQKPTGGAKVKVGESVAIDFRTSVEKNREATNFIMEALGQGKNADVHHSNPRIFGRLGSAAPNNVNRDERVLLQYRDPLSYQVRVSCVEEAWGNYWPGGPEWRQCISHKTEGNCTERSQLIVTESTELSLDSLRGSINKCMGTAAVAGVLAGYYSGYTEAALLAFVETLSLCVAADLGSKAFNMQHQERSREVGWGNC